MEASMPLPWQAEKRGWTELEAEAYVNGIKELRQARSLTRLVVIGENA